jgi:hypothetical protein
MRKSGHALYCAAVLAVTVGGAAAHAAVYTAIEPGRHGAMQVSGRWGGVQRAAAENASPNDGQCAEQADWAAWKRCLAGRERVLFPTKPPTEATLKAMRDRGLLVAPFARALPEAPAELPPTLDEQSERNKELTRRRFDQELNLDFQREFQDFIDQR